MRFIKRVMLLLIIILVLAFLSIYWNEINNLITGKVVDDTSNGYQYEEAVLTRVVDGDTIKVNINETEETIRLLGINTPEKGKAFSNEAKNFLKQFENENIKLLRDKEDIDRYKRKLRYVLYNDRLLNVEILENGYATSFMLDELKFKDKFVSAEKYAKDNEKTLWKKSKDVCSDCIELIELNPEEDYFIIENSCNHDCSLINWSVKDDANHFFNIESLKAKHSKTYKSDKEVWNDDKDRFFLRDNKGELVVFYEYS
ncbi:MAG: thermonuclease family protein [Nanoarchaeota archaeon]|nr:thermonuclease family protein [Nanoarchaeota archaeon]